MSPLTTEDLLQVFESVRDEVIAAASESDGEIDWCDLCGGCAIASLWLFEALTDLGYEPRFVGASGHCWIRFGKWSVDLTAQQFDESLPEILMVLTIEEETYPNFKGGHQLETTDIGEIEYFMKDWPAVQNPFNYK